MKYFIGTSLTMVYGQKNTMINLQRYYHDIFGCVVVEVAVMMTVVVLAYAFKNSCASGCRPSLEKCSVPTIFIDSIN